MKVLQDHSAVLLVGKTAAADISQDFVSLTNSACTLNPLECPLKHAKRRKREISEIKANSPEFHFQDVNAFDFQNLPKCFSHIKPTLSGFASKSAKPRHSDLGDGVAFGPLRSRGTSSFRTGRASSQHDEPKKLSRVLCEVWCLSTGYLGKLRNI